MYPYREYLLVASLVFGGALMMAGCSQPKPATPDETPTPAQPAVEPTSPEASVEVVPPQDTETTPMADAAPPSAAEASAAAPPAAEAPLPEVRLVTIAQLDELVKGTLGKVTVLNIWATWCVPCVQEMPDLVKFYNETSRDEVAFISLSIDAESDITDAIPKFQRAHQVPFPIYVLNERDDEALTKALRGPFSGAAPTTMIYDASGALVKSEVGVITLAELQEIVKTLREVKP